MKFDPTTWGFPFPIVVAVLYGIVFCRAFATYWLGRAVAAGADRTRLKRIMHSDGYQKALKQIDKWGPPIVAASFLTVGFQTLMNLAAGGTRMRLSRYLPALLIGGFFWALLYAYIGFVSVIAFAKLWNIHPALAIGILVVAIAALAWFIIRTSRISENAPEAG